MTTSAVLATTSQQLLAAGHLDAAVLVLDAALAERREGR